MTETETELFAIFERTGAILKGHFQLASGLHTDTYIQCSRLTERPVEMEMLCRELAGKWDGTQVDVVVGPAYGGILPAYELARHLGARSVFCERAKEGSFELRRGFRVEGDRVLVAEDVITTGGSAKEAVDLVGASGGTVVGVASFVDRGVDKKFTEDHRFLLSITPPTWSPGECPRCRAGEEAVKPGTKPCRV